MARLGISIYPEHASLEENIGYIQKAAKCGFTRIFSCLLSLKDKSDEEIKSMFLALSKEAHTCGMEIFVDVSPAVFAKLHISYEDLSFFESIQVDGIRLDEGFGGLKEAQMTHNPQKLIIELNASLHNGMIANVDSHQPDKSHLTTCHNFYPQRYSGLSLKHFQSCNADIRKLGLRIAAFVGSQNPNAYGPWPLTNGLCTLEMHRNLPLDVQVRHLLAMGEVDDIIIANAMAYDEELEQLAQLNGGVFSLRIALEKKLSEVEYKILYESEHFVRGDVSEYMYRSTQTRVTYASEKLPSGNTRAMKRGDIVIVNEADSRYKGELHIVLQDMENDGRKNVVGHILENELFLLDYLQPWQTFQFLK